MAQIISESLGENYPHGTHSRYRYEVQVQRNGGPAPCAACKAINAADAKKSRYCRTRILDRFRDQNPEKYKAWYEEFEGQYIAFTRKGRDEPRTSQSPGNGGEAGTS